MPGIPPNGSTQATRPNYLPDIRKVTQGSTSQIAEEVDQLYASIITAGTYKAENIRVAEAAKVIENTQRDLTIVLVNELAIIFNKMDIVTESVLQAAGTKWNFLPFRLGLVGGHCIGVDPYYLTRKVEVEGYLLQVILVGRRINAGMGAYVAGQLIKAILKRRIQVEGAKVLMLGFAFKENCPDFRNTLVIDVIRELENYGIVIDIHDPWVDVATAKHEYGYDLVTALELGMYDGVILGVAHDEFCAMGAERFRAYA